MNNIYELIQSKIQNAPTRYDDVIKNKSSIYWKVGLALSLVPSLILGTLLLFVPGIRVVMGKSFVLFPICVSFLSFVLSSTFASAKLDDLYKNIIPDKKYVSYEKGYKDDIDQYLKDSEILIGKNAHNMDNRNQIRKVYEKYKKYIPYELMVLAVISIIVIIMGLFTKTVPYY